MQASRRPVASLGLISFLLSESRKVLLLSARSRTRWILTSALSGDPSWIGALPICLFDIDKPHFSDHSAF